jgi:hypothetical protein
LNYQAGPFIWFFESSAPLLIFVDQVVIFQIPGWKVGGDFGSIFLMWCGYFSQVVGIKLVLSQLV